MFGIDDRDIVVGSSTLLFAHWNAAGITNLLLRLFRCSFGGADTDRCFVFCSFSTTGRSRFTVDVEFESPLLVLLTSFLVVLQLRLLLSSVFFVVDIILVDLIGEAVLELPLSLVFLVMVDALTCFGLVLGNDDETIFFLVVTFGLLLGKDVVVVFVVDDVVEVADFVTLPQVDDVFFGTFFWLLLVVAEVCFDGDDVFSLLLLVSSSLATTDDGDGDLDGDVVVEGCLFFFNVIDDFLVGLVNELFFVLVNDQFLVFFVNDLSLQGFFVVNDDGFLVGLVRNDLFLLGIVVAVAVVVGVAVVVVSSISISVVDAVACCPPLLFGGIHGALIVRLALLYIPLPEWIFFMLYVPLNHL